SIGVRLLRPALYEILDTAPRGAIVHRVRESAASVPGVVEIDKCFVRKMGLSFYVDLHAKVDGKISVREGHHIAHEVKRALQESDPRIADVLVHIEPAKNLLGNRSGCQGWQAMRLPYNSLTSARIASVKAARTRAICRANRNNGRIDPGCLNK